MDKTPKKCSYTVWVYQTDYIHKYSDPLKILHTNLKTYYAIYTTRAYMGEKIDLVYNEKQEHNGVIMDNQLISNCNNTHETLFHNMMMTSFNNAQNAHNEIVSINGDKTTQHIFLSNTKDVAATSIYAQKHIKNINSYNTQDTQDSYNTQDTQDSYNTQDTQDSYNTQDTQDTKIESTLSLDKQDYSNKMPKKNRVAINARAYEKRKEKLKEEREKHTGIVVCVCGCELKMDIRKPIAKVHIQSPNHEYLRIQLYVIACYRNINPDAKIKKVITNVVNPCGFGLIKRYRKIISIKEKCFGIIVRQRNQMIKNQESLWCPTKY